MPVKHGEQGKIMNPADPDTLRENMRQMFDGMRAYHESEISHANHAITMLVAVGGAAGTGILTLLYPETPPANTSAIAWGLWIAVAVLNCAIAVSSQAKINSDHKVYASFGDEYVKTAVLLGLYETVVVGNDSLSIKTNREIGKGNGYRRTQTIIWSFAGVVTFLTLVFAVCVG